MNVAMRSSIRNVVIPLMVAFLAVAGLGVIHGFGGSRHLAGQFVHRTPRASSHKHADCILQEFGLTATAAKSQNLAGSRAMALAHAPGNAIVQVPLLTSAEIHSSRATGVQTRNSSPVFTGAFRI
jgi:hypothetical protein